MTDLVAEIILFSFAGFCLLFAVFLALRKHTTVAVAFVSTFTVLSILAGMGPKSIETFKRSSDGSIELSRALSKTEINDSVAFGTDSPELSNEKISKLIEKAEELPVYQRTDADYLALSMNAFRKGLTLEALKFAYAGLTVPSTTKRIEATLKLRVASAFNTLELQEESIVVLDEIIMFLPGFSWAYHNKGNIFLDMKKYSEALELYDKAILLDPDLVLPHVNRALALIGLNRIEEAHTALDRAMVLDPNYAKAYEIKANLYEKSGSDRKKNELKEKWLQIQSEGKEQK